MDVMATTSPSGGAAGLLTRRRVLRLAGAAVVVPFVACRQGSSRPGADPLLELGRALRADHGVSLAQQLPRDVTAGLDDPAAVRAALDEESETVRDDFARARTVDAQGWLLGEREAAILIAYADG